MKRRTNKSHKVPNVKLRPAEKGSFSRLLEESCLAQDTQPGSDDTTTYDLCPRPFKGFAICATGIQDKPTLFKQAVELGATTCTAFTDRVTHLVASDHGGAKYMCALERKIPIMKPSWVTESFQIWLKGDDVDVPKSVQDHRLPIFSGVVVCLSGIKDLARRNQISKVVYEQGGEYVRNLERPVRVTHLLCSGDEETEKMRYAEKFNTRGEAKIHLVWEEWFWDSLDFGGRFDEATYQVRRPRPERKVHSSPPPLPSSDLPSQHDEIPSSSMAQPNPPRASKPPQRSTDEADDEQAFVNVLPAVTLQLWGSLLQRRGYEIADGEVILSPSKAKAAAESRNDGLPARHPVSPVKQPESQAGGAGKSVISQFRRANSFAPAISSKEASSSRHLPFRRTTTTTAAFAGNSEAGPSKLPQQNALAASSGSGSAPAPPQIFAGMRIRALGEAKGPTVRQAVEQHGGRMVTDPDEDVDFIVVRLVSGSKLYREEDDEFLRVKFRTECWLEQCIWEERICEPDEHVTYRPLSIQTPVPGAEDLVITISGFDHAQTLGIQRLFRALGITQATKFTHSSTHLLCPSGTGAKFNVAQKWGVPVVGMEFFAAIARTGEVPPPHDYLVTGPAPGAAERAGRPHTPAAPEHGADAMDVDLPVAASVTPVKKDVKGKGKAVDAGMDMVRPRHRPAQDGMDVDVGNMMNDITKDIQSELNVSTPRKRSSKNIDRQPTTIIPLGNPEAPENMSFGAPNGLLGGEPTFIHPSSLATPGTSVRSLPVQGPRLPSESFVLDKVQSRDSSLRRRQTTVLNIEPEAAAAGESSGSSGYIQQHRHQPPRHQYVSERDRRERIPSSTSPSPMKMPMQRTSSRSSLSPVKIPHEAAKALQESITSLLGKRPSPDGEDREGAVAAGGEGGAVAGGAAGEAGRNGKRARPQRPKPQSRQPSDALIGGERPAPAPVPPVRKRSSRLAAGAYAAAPASPSADGGVNPFDAYADQANDNTSAIGRARRTGPEDSSMRVMYEDPAQKEEQKRLLSLLKSQEESQGSRRRSARIAGF